MIAAQQLKTADCHCRHHKEQGEGAGDGQQLGGVDAGGVAGDAGHQDVDKGQRRHDHAPEDLDFGGGSSEATSSPVRVMEATVVVMDSHRVTTDRKAVIIKTTDRILLRGRLLKKAKTAASVPKLAMDS